MKKNKILPFCLVLLTSFGLVGCNDNTSSSISSPTSSEYIQRITLNASADKVITIGQEINIDNYINLLGKDSTKVTPSDTNYTVSVTIGSDLGTLDGHKFVASKEGTIRLTVASSEDSSVKASLELTSVSSLKKRFVTDTQDITDKFTLEGLETDSSGMLVIDEYGYIGDQTGSIHSTNFFAICNTDETYGYLTGSDSETYYFTCADRFGTDLVVNPGPTGTEISNYYLAADFSISALSDTSTTVDGDGNEVLELTQTSTETFIQYGLGYSVSRITAYGYSILPAQIDYQPVTFFDMNGEKVQKEMPIIYTRISVSGEEALLSASILEYGDNYSLKGIDEYIETVGTPDPIQDPGVDTAIKAINSGENFTKQETFGWFKASLDSNGESFESYVPTEAPEIDADIASFFPRSDTPSVSKVLATQDKVQETFISGYGNLTPEASEGEEVTNGFYTYSVNSEDATKVDTTTNISTDSNVLKIGDVTTTSADKGDKSVYSYISATKGLGGTSFSSKYIASATTTKDKTDETKETTKVVLNSGKYASSLLDSLVTNSSYNRLGLLADWTQIMWGSSLEDAVSTVGMLSDVIITYTKDGDNYTSLQVSGCIVWSVNSDSTYTVARWAFDFSNIGTTVIE